MISFTVPAIPIAQPRQRSAVIAGKVRTYTPTRHPVNAFKASVRLAAQQAYTGPPFEGPLQVVVVFVLPRPKRLCWKRKPMPREWAPVGKDADNLMKSTWDALKGLVWRDDCQICVPVAAKVYAAGDEQPHVEIAIRELGECWAQVGTELLLAWVPSSGVTLEDLGAIEVAEGE